MKIINQGRSGPSTYSEGLANRVDDIAEERSAGDRARYKVGDTVIVRWAGSKPPSPDETPAPGRGEKEYVAKVASVHAHPEYKFIYTTEALYDGRVRQVMGDRLRKFEEHRTKETKPKKKRVRPSRKLVPRS